MHKIKAFIKEYGPASLAGAIVWEIAHHMPSNGLAIAVWGGVLGLSFFVWAITLLKFHKQHP